MDASHPRRHYDDPNACEEPLSDPAACVHVFGWMDVWTGLDKAVKAWLKK
jgi:hypothetical protein